MNTIARHQECLPMFASYCKLQRDNIAKILACSQGFTRKFSIFGAFERNSL